MNNQGGEYAQCEVGTVFFRKIYGLVFMRGSYFVFYRSFSYSDPRLGLKLHSELLCYYYILCLTDFHLNRKAELSICGLALRW